VRSTEETTGSDISPEAILRQLIQEALQKATAEAEPKAGPCGCDHHAAPAVHAASPARVAATEVGDTLHRGFKAAPVVTAVGAVVGVVALLSTVTALMLAVALTGLAVSVASVVLLLVVRMLKKEMGK